MNNKSLKIALILTVAIVLFVSFIIKVSAPLPIIQKFPNSLKLKPETLYRLKETNINAARGDIITSKFEGITSRALSTKTNLIEPHKKWSIDGQVWTLNCAVDSLLQPCQTQYQVDRNLLNEDRIDKNNVWAGKLPQGYAIDTFPKTSQIVPFYFIAGIDAGESDVQTKQEKLKAIQKGIPKLIKMVESDGHESLAIPIFGAGAATVDFKNALNTILNSINDFILKEKSPSDITLILWPGSEFFKKEGEKVNERLFRKQTQTYDAQVRVLKEVISSSNSYDKNIPSWEYLKKRKFFSQILQLITAPLLSGLFFLILFKNAPISIRWTVILEQFVLYIAAITGISFGKLILDFNPFNWTQFLVIFLLGLIIPIWRWLKLGKPNEKTT